MGETFILADALGRSRELFARLDQDNGVIAAELVSLSYRHGFEDGQNVAARLLA